ncbi:MAG: AEC family transporter [Sphingobacteriia bacterium]|nr:AEC family transporter [Sphingobacteriia bacterium]
MINNFLMVGQQVLILFILISIGLIATKAKMINEKAVKGMTNIVLYFVTPCVIIKSFQRTLDSEMVKNLVSVFLIAILIHVLSIILAHLIIKDNDESRCRVLRFGVVFSNCGFMSLPLQQAILGDDGVFYGAVYVATFNIVVWSYGLLLMSGNRNTISLKKVAINPGIIGVIVGVLLAILPMKLPIVVLQPIEYLSALNTPLPMLIIGFYLAKLDFKNIFKDAKRYGAIFLRLVVVPLISIGFMYACGVRGDVLVVCAIASSAPTAATSTMFSTKFKRDTALSAELVSISTLISLITMPLIVGLSQYLS